MLWRTKIGGRMTRDYMLVMGVIGLLTIMTYGLMAQMMRAQIDNSRMVAAAAAQGTLSQRIPMLAQQLAQAAQASQRRTLRAELAQARDAYWQSHLALSGAEPGGAPQVAPDIAAIYFGGPDWLDQQSRAFVAGIDTVLAAPPGQIAPRDVAGLADLARGPMLGALGRAVVARQSAAEADMTWLRTLQGGLVTAIVAVLALAGALVFAPTVRRVERMTESLIEARGEMEHSALHDSLTGLPNRRYLDDFLSRTLANARRNGHTVGLLHLDLDRFKEVNDTHGHKAGDAVLQATARIMLASVRTSDFVARVGGDEFIIVSPEQRQVDGLNILAQRLIDRLSQPMPYESVMTEVNASIGIAFAPADHEMDADRLMIAADIALYRAKNLGRAQFHIYTAPEQPAAAPGVATAAPQLTLITGGGRA